MDTPSPYQPPVAGPAYMPPPPPGAREPGAIKVFGVIHLVFAGLGLLMGLWYIFSSWLNGLFINPKTPGYQAQVKFQQDTIWVNVLYGIMTLILAVLLFRAGLKLVRSNPAGVRASNIYAWASIISKGLSMVIGIVWVLPATKAMTREMMEAPGGLPPSAGAKMGEFMDVFMAASIIASPLIACIYPVLALILLNGTKVNAWCVARSQDAS